MDRLREDIDNLEEEAKRHETRIANSEQKVSDLQQQIADMPPPPQVFLQWLRQCSAALAKGHKLY